MFQDFPKILGLNRPSSVSGAGLQKDRDLPLGYCFPPGVSLGKFPIILVLELISRLFLWWVTDPI